MIIKVSFLAAATIAAYAVSHKNSCNSSKNPPENDDSSFQQHQMEGEMEDEKETEINQIIRSKELKSVNEKKVLHNLVEEVQQRKMRLERKLLELCGLREEQSYMAHLQRHLEDKSLETEMLNATIASMQAERKNLHEDVKQCVLARKQLEMARKVIAEMQKKMDYCNEINMKIKARLLIVEEQVSNFPRDEDEGNSVRDAIVEKKLKDVRNVELQVLKMNRRNKELELGKRELVLKLVSAQEKITALSNITESESITKNGLELSKLRYTNENLLLQVERLQNNRFDMVQELVYQRWLNTCLRLEIQTHKSSKISNPSSDSASSQTSTTNLSDEMFETTTMDMDNSSSSSQTSSTGKKFGFMHSIKKWGARRSKDERPSGGNSLSKKGLVRRFSTSMVPVKASILRNKGDNAVKSRGRRVSFSDSIGSTVQSEGVFDDHKEMGMDEKSGCSSIQNCNSKVQGERHNELASPQVTISSAILKSIKEDGTEMATVSLVDQENKVDNNVVGLVVALFFFLFILVACFTYDTARPPMRN